MCSVWQCGHPSPNVISKLIETNSQIMCISHPLQIDNKIMARSRVQTVYENAQIKTTTNKQERNRRVWTRKMYKACGVLRTWCDIWQTVLGELGISLFCFLAFDMWIRTRMGRSMWWCASRPIVWWKVFGRCVKKDVLLFHLEWRWMMWGGEVLLGCSKWLGGRKHASVPHSAESIQIAMPHLL